MNKLILIALLFFSPFIKAQHDISTDLLGFAFSNYGLGYEYALNSQNSVGINVNFASKNLFDDGKSAYGKIDNYSEMNIIPEYKMFLTPNKGNDGFYLGAYGRFRTSNSKDNKFDYQDPNNPNPLVSEKTDVSTTGFALGALTGYKWKTTSLFFFEFTFGVGKFITNSIDVSNNKTKDLTKNEFNEDDYVPYIGNGLPVDLRLAIKIGLRFGGGNSSTN